MITPYCTCSDTLAKWQYIIGGAMPTIIVGFIPTVIEIYCNNFLLFFVFWAMIAGGGGDALIISGNNVTSLKRQRMCIY